MAPILKALLGVATVVLCRASKIRPRRARLRAAQAMRTTECFTRDSLDWTSEDGQIKVNGKPFHLKGVSWFGFETPNEFPHGLWSVTMDEVFGFLKNNSFNAVRMPVSAYLALNPMKQVKAQVMDAQLRDLTAIDLIGAVIDKAADHGIMVMLDLHRLNENEIPPLWYDETYTASEVLTAWDNLLEPLAGKWNLFALDLKNEPHGPATWGAGLNDTDWNKFAETLGKHIYTKHTDFKGLVFVEGVQMPNSTTHKIDMNNKWWGGDLEGVHDFPIDLGNEDWNKRVVYSPHVYGPGVFEQDYFKVKSFPDNMADIWHDQWSFVEEATGRAVVIGEWGGFYEGKDKVWQDALAQYLTSECFEDTFYWCLNPNSGDTGGLLDYDFKTPKTEKLKLLATVQPNPSWLEKSDLDDKQVCFTPGQYADSRCANPSARRKRRT